MPKFIRQALIKKRTLGTLSIGAAFVMDADEGAPVHILIDWAANNPHGTARCLDLRSNTVHSWTPETMVFHVIITEVSYTLLYN